MKKMRHGKKPARHHGMMMARGKPRSTGKGLVRATRRKGKKPTKAHESMGADILGDTPF